jgi:thiol-disulfide isomerase/thioredoxin
MRLLLILLTALPLLLQAETPIATLAPAKPRIGDKLTITYEQAAKGAALRGVKSITAQVLVIRGTALPLLIELPMKQKVNTWTAATPLKDADARVVLVRFVDGGNPEKGDDNGGAGWSAMVYDAAGAPLRHAHRLNAMLYRAGAAYDFTHTRDVDLAKKELAAEIAQYPDDWMARATVWDLRMREQPSIALKDSIREDLLRVVASAKGDEELIAGILPWFQRVGLKDRGDALRDSCVKANPKGKIAQSTRLTVVYGERDAVKRIPLIESYLADFPSDTTNALNLRSALLLAYLQKKDFEKADAALAAMQKPDPMVLNSMAWSCVEDTVQLEKAAAWAGRAVSLLRKPDPSTKPSHMSRAAWDKANTGYLVMALDTYGAALSLLGRDQDALAAYDELLRLPGEKDAEIIERYLRLCLRAGKPERAFAGGLTSLRAGTGNDRIVAITREAYIKQRGSDAGFEAEVEKARSEARTQLRARLQRERTSEPAVDFSLPALDGRTVKLSDLRGKVVIVDFWATWCGPCKMSFPTLQKVYDTYKGNDRVMILALDTWERVRGKEREELVTKFLTDNKYTFPVLYDENTVEKYGVTGIPTKFIIDREGRIAFKSIGFDGAEKMWDELTAEIDLLLSE